MPKKLEGLKPRKPPQVPSKVKIHIDVDFSSNLVHFLAEVGRALAELGVLKPSK